MSGNDFEAGGRKFKLSKIDVFKQFHIVRRIGPILADMLPAMKDLAKFKDQTDLSESQKLDAFAEIAAPIISGFSKLSDADSERVLFGLLSSVEVQQPEFGSWGKVATDKAILMQDIELPVLLQVAGRAFAFNLSGFFSALPRK